MDRQQKIKNIYDVVADKGLSFGCMVMIKFHSNAPLEPYIILWEVGYEYVLSKFQGWKGFWWVEKALWGWPDTVTRESYAFEKIIGHPVMISNVLKRMEVMYGVDDDEGENIPIRNHIVNELIHEQLWMHLNRSIDEQPDDCIDFIYDLVIWKIK